MIRRVAQRYRRGRGADVRHGRPGMQAPPPVLPWLQRLALWLETNSALLPLMMALMCSLWYCYQCKMEVSRLESALQEQKRKSEDTVTEFRKYIIETKHNMTLARKEFELELTASKQMYSDFRAQANERVSDLYNRLREKRSCFDFVETGIRGAINFFSGGIIRAIAG
eukprot:scpid95780/ scgid11014/ 